MKLFHLVPINGKKIFFSSYEGKQFSCNPKYIFMKLQEITENLMFVYEYNNKDCIPTELENVTVVKHNSIPYFFHMLTSKVIVSNNAISPKIPIRDSQYVINTWHGGGAFKKVGIDIDSNLNGMDREMLELSAKQTNLFFASSEGFYNGTGKSSCIPKEKVYFVGMPRNDIFFADEQQKNFIGKKVLDYYGIDESVNILLYAPTFRGSIGSALDVQSERFEWSKIQSALETRFPGEWRLMFRGHYHSKETLGNIDDMIDASDYPDMQELLVAASALITDYSSVIWDFSLTNKPGFLFCPDLESYMIERDFYTPIEIWPYRYATNSSDLSNIIRDFDFEENKYNCESYQKLLNCFEDGHSTEIVSRIIITAVNRSIQGRRKYNL